MTATQSERDLDAALAQLPQHIGDPQRDDLVWAGIARETRATPTRHRLPRRARYAIAASLVLAVVAGIASVAITQGDSGEILVAESGQDDRTTMTREAWETIPASYRAAEYEVLADLPQDAREKTTSNL